MKKLLVAMFLMATSVFGQSTATNLTAINPSVPLDTDPISQGAGQLRGLKQGTIGSFYGEHRLDGRHIRFFSTDSGSLNNVVLNIPFTTQTYEQGMIFTFLPGFTNTGPVTLNVINTNNVSLGITNIFYNGVNLKPATLIPSNICEVVWDGEVFQMISVPSNTFANTITSGTTNGEFFISYTGPQTPVFSAGTLTFTSLFNSQSPPFLTTNTYSQIKLDADFLWSVNSSHSIQPAFVIVNGFSTNTVTLFSVGINGSTASNVAHYCYVAPIPNGGTIDFKFQPDANSSSVGGALADFEITGIK